MLKGAYSNLKCLTQMVYIFLSDKDTKQQMRLVNCGCGVTATTLVLGTNAKWRKGSNPFIRTATIN